MTSTTHDTIVAPATSYGISSLNIVRVSGKNALNIAMKLAKKESYYFQPRKAKLTKIYFINNEILDECIIIYFKAPYSYTTEDVIEFQCHGGYFIARSIIEECLKLNARLAQNGEFTKRAFLGGRIDLSQAQAIAKLIQSNNAKAHKILMRHLKGEMQDFCLALRENLIKILAHSEVFIDYADEDIPLNLLTDTMNELQEIIKKLNHILEQSRQKKMIFDGYKVCIIGKPNVGKSSLLNALLNNDRAIVSDIAGTTRDSIEESFMTEKHLLKLIDTAGIRKSHDIIENEGIKRSIKKAEESDLLIALFDNSLPFSNEDEEIIKILNQYKKDKKIITLINKIDLANHFDDRKINDFNPLPISLATKNNQSIDKFKEYLQSIIDNEYDDDTLIVSSQYQFQAIQATIASLRESISPLEYGELELFSFHINEAIQSISSITKPYEYSQMLDKMFSEFCVGK